MLRIELVDWKTAKSQACQIRLGVFVKEQGVPVVLEVDENDAVSLHALAFEDDVVVGTARLLPDGHIGRIAVMKPWRGRGVGTALLRSLIGAARARGDSEIMLSAQVHALGFYQMRGFVPEGTIYDEAGIPHQMMRLRLR